MLLLVLSGKLSKGGGKIREKPEELLCWKAQLRGRCRLCLPPAEGVAVLEGGAVDQPALLLQPSDDVFICILKTQILLRIHISLSKLLQDLSHILQLIFKKKILCVTQHLHTHKKISIKFIHLLQELCKTLNLQSYLLSKPCLFTVSSVCLCYLDKLKFIN